MENNPQVLGEDTPLWQAIGTIAEHDAVLIRDDQNLITGIVTSFDIAERYHSMAEPFLLLGEIENILRQLIVLANFPLAVIRAAKDPNDETRQINNVANLTFGEYVRLLENPENWKRIPKKLSRKEFISEIKTIQKIRNEVMHFSPDPIDSKSLKSLQRTAKMMRKLKLFDKVKALIGGVG
jgi:hypothetical protein